MDIAVMFGLSLDGTATHTIIPPIELTLARGQVMFITGSSGGGKSTLLRLIRESLASHTDPPPAILSSDTLPDLPNTAIVDALAYPEGQDNAASPATLEQTCRWLSLTGLSDAAVMLRKPPELSEGQRHRLRLAQAMAIADRRPEAWSILLADEFGSSLDRPTAFALARCVRRWASMSNVCLVCATTHDDLLEPLCPDVLIEVAPGGVCDVHRRPA